MPACARKILLVDDDAFFRQVLTDALRENHQVIETGSGLSALKLAVKEQPDLIILDVEMPDESGIEVCRQLKDHQHTRHIPILLLSALTRKEEIIRGLQAGADDYLTKPMYPPEIAARVEAHLRSKSYYAELEHRDLLMLLELSERLTVTRNPMKILRLIVDKISEVVDVARCSIVSYSRTGELVVKVSSDLPGDSEIKLDLARYPEIKQALKTRQTVVIDDIANDPLMEPVRSLVRDLGFHSVIVIPIIKKESVIGTFFLRTAGARRGHVSRRVYNLCHLVANISANALENATLFESMRTAQEFLEEMAIRDGLTRLYTHRYFYDRLDEEFSRAMRYQHPLSVIFLDIDDFKRINDSFGHTRGDDVLRQIGHTLKTLMRDSDIPARYGGEEFAVLLPNTAAAGAADMARRVSEAIRLQRFDTLPGEVVTVSVGVATYEGRGPSSYAELVERADAAMYQAKRSGKDRICLASAPQAG